MNFSSVLDKIGEWNPQLLRELKGRLKPRNIVVFSAISLCLQMLLYSFYQSLVPNYQYINNHFDRYCIGNPSPDWNGYEHYYDSNNFCLQDAFGNLTINWQLWWLDIFITTSIIAIFVLLVGGTYLLIADLSKEESRGTLNFIRLAPQSARSILTGKILGVPALLYWVIILGITLNFGAAMGAAIPFLLLIGFYGITIACCAFFYTAALFYGLAVPKLMGFQAWLGGGAVLFFLWGMTAFTVESHQEDAIGNVADWLTLFYPGKVLAYLVHATSVAEKAHYLNLEQITQLSWFQLHLWENAFTGMFFILLNLGIGIYFLGQGIKRRFHNPIATPITKQQSYWLTTSLVAILAGFSLESLDYYDRPTGLWENMLGLLCFQVPLFLGLIAALSPERQTLQDWARYRHQAGAKNTSKNLLQDLIWGEKSPSTLAIAINLAIASLIQLPLLLILPLEHYKLAAFTGILLNISIMLIYASVAQLMLMMKTSKRQINLGCCYHHRINRCPPHYFWFISTQSQRLFRSLALLSSASCSNTRCWSGRNFAGINNSMGSNISSSIFHDEAIKSRRCFRYQSFAE